MTNKPTLTLGPVELYVKDLALTTKFYTQLCGLTELESTNNCASLGDDGKPVIKLYFEENFKTAASNDAGLYHTAILYPTQAKLAKALDRIFKTMPQLYQGSADHTVSEAFYFADPDGNGVELYFDKPRSEWIYQDGVPVMGSVYIDEVQYVEKYMAAPDNNEQIKIGHVHLKVGNLTEAKEFYIDTLMFDTIFSMPTALFVSKDGYHHHLGMNTWQSLGASKRTQNNLGLKSFELQYHDGGLFNKIKVNLKGNFKIIDEKHITTSDPWGNEIAVSLLIQK